jgi:hypothetical protein
MHVIQIRLQSLNQLFDSLDPSPFREKSLDRDAEAYLLECAGERPFSEPIEIAVHAPPGLLPHLDDIASAIHEHFRLLHIQSERRHRRRARVTRVALLIGFVVLVGALVLRRVVAGWSGPMADVFAEGLLILAWVALWRPAEVALFDHWENREQRRQLERLATVPVRIVPDRASAEAAPGMPPQRPRSGSPID